MNQQKKSPSRSPRTATVLRISLAAGLLLILGLAFWLRAPRISAGSPFFYHEDEAHHFNRLVQMVQSGDLNPHYFRKPSLHFYLRIPSVAASFLLGVRNGALRSIREIDTRDRYGLAGYSFSASHPVILKGARLFGVLLSLGIIVLTYLLALSVTGSRGAGLAAAALAAVSPALVEESAFIGVDVPMAFFCLIAVWFAIKVVERFTLPGLAGLGIACGLAISTKYNAAPIALLPVVGCLLASQRSLPALMIALVTPVVGFLLASPFIVVSLPLFLDQLAYEIWHYGIAGHVGHEAQPGIAQALFYLRWFNSQAIGPVASAFGVVGMFVLLARPKKATFMLLTFPLLYFVLMAAQKANFTRNVLVLIPFLCVFSVAVMHLILETLEVSLLARIGALAAFVLVAGFYPVRMSLAARVPVLPESRRDVMTWLAAEQASSLQSTGLAGVLQFPADAYRTSGVSRIEGKTFAGSALWLDGFERVVVPQEDAASLEGMYLPERMFEGITGEQRIVQNPAMSALRAKGWNDVRTALAPAIPVLNLDAAGAPVCRPSPGEDYCWTSTRAVRIASGAVPEEGLPLKFSVMSPWPGQRLLLLAGEWSQAIELVPGQWTEVTATVPHGAAVSEGGVTAVLSVVDVPALRGASTDKRRLGMAVRGKT